MTSKYLWDWKIWAVALLLALLLMGCSVEDGAIVQPAPAQSFMIDPTFKEFYATLGGQEILGPAISELEQRADQTQCQYTINALMCFNPTDVGGQRFRLYSLGKELDIREDSHQASLAAPEGMRIVDGYRIYEKFVPLYDRLFGALYAGAPLTELRVNYDLNRYEQFFANIGFYQTLDDPNGPVFLMPYGAYLCHTCSYQTNDYWFIIKSNMVEQPFAESVARLGGSAVFGTPQLQPEVVDGMLRQVYSNAIFQAPLDDISQVSLYPLPAALGHMPDGLFARQVHDQLIFFTLDQQTGLGHNVPKPFEQYIALHGSTALSGNPIEEIKQVPGENLYRQCFEKLCLLYDPVASASLKVRLAPLGKEYMERVQYNPQLNVVNIFTPEQVALMIATDRPTLSSSESQYVRIIVEWKESQQGIPSVGGDLVLSFAERTPLHYSFPPTDGEGMSLVEITPQSNLKNGDRIQYQVCLNLPSEQPICRKDSYLIWNNK